MALALVAALGSDGANYCAIEFDGPGLASLSMDDRLVLSNLMVESGAKAAMFPCDEVTSAFLTSRGIDRGAPVAADPGAAYLRELTWDLSTTVPQIARPHAPDNVGPLADAAGTPVHMVFIGTCTGGRVVDFHDALRAFQRAGGSVAPGVQLVLTPASREVHDALVADGTLDAFVRAGATVTETGCGACCGTSGVIPGDEATVLSTANRNFKARMGNRTAAIYLASPAACGAAAAIGAVSGAAMIIHGRARVFGDDVNTDYIISSSRKRQTIDAQALKAFLFESIAPGFAASVQPGDVIVARQEFRLWIGHGGCRHRAASGGDRRRARADIRAELLSECDQQRAGGRRV